MYPFLLWFFLCTQMNSEDIPQCLFVKMRQPSNSQIGKRKWSSLFFIYRVKYIVWIIWIWDIPTSSSVCILYSVRNQQLNCKRIQSQKVVIFKENNKTNTSQRYSPTHCVEFYSRITLNLKLYFTSEFAFLNKWMSRKLPSLWKTCRYKSYF